MLLLNGDCLDLLKELPDESIDLVFCDLPYGQTSCEWDSKIDMSKLWAELLRVKKLRTPLFFTTTTKFGVELINSSPKNCPFRYDIVWAKSACSGFLCAKKMPMRKHEMIYVFYEKLPLYDLSSHKHKFIKEVPTKRAGKDNVDNKGMIKNRSKSGMETQNKYDPPLPVSVVKEPELRPEYQTDSELYGDIKRADFKRKGGESMYNPPLPVSVIQEEEKPAGAIHSGTIEGAGTYGQKRKTPLRRAKKGEEREWVPPLPKSIVHEDKHTLYGEIKEKGIPHTTTYDPPLPNSMLEIKSTRGKHSTEKPVELISWILKYYSKEGDVVLDPTMGSGSAGVAAKQMNRDFVGFEKDEEIYNSAVQRLEEF